MELEGDLWRTAPQIITSALLTFSPFDWLTNYIIYILKKIHIFHPYIELEGGLWSTAAQFSQVPSLLFHLLTR